MQKIFLFMLFISFTALIVSDIEFQPNGTTFQDYSDNVMDYAEASTDLYETGFVAIVQTLESTLEIGEAVIDAFLFIPRAFGFDDVVEGCVDFETLGIFQQLNYDATYTFWRIFNPNTPESVYQAQWAINNGYTGVCS
jgi:hypothetical protein